MSDMDNPETGDLLRKYLGTKQSVDGRYRAQLFHAIRDLTADSYGGYKAVSTIQAGGGLYAQRIVTRNHYDMEHAKRLAREAAGINLPSSDVKSAAE
jgi:4-hydroxybutyryl-CoA dehydratase/vinylacetyl-CoA-Delta-isomerase